MVSVATPSASRRPTVSMRTVRYKSSAAMRRWPSAMRRALNRSPGETPNARSTAASPSTGCDPLGVTCTLTSPIQVTGPGAKVIRTVPARRAVSPAASTACGRARAYPASRSATCSESASESMCTRSSGVPIRCVRTAAESPPSAGSPATITCVTFTGAPSWTSNVTRARRSPWRSTSAATVAPMYPRSR